MRKLIESFMDDPIDNFLMLLLALSLIIFPLVTLLILVRDYQ